MFGRPATRLPPGHAAQAALDGVICWPRRRRDTGCAARGVPNLAARDGRGASDEEVTRADQTIDRAADKLQELANKAATQDGFKRKLAQPLADDAEFLRKLKPSLIAARVRGEAPTDQKPVSGAVAPAPQAGPRPKREGGPNPWLVVAVGLAAGIALAKWIDWRGHAHPRD